jgi:hypothetical protein
MICHTSMSCWLIIILLRVRDISRSTWRVLCTHAVEPCFAVSVIEMFRQVSSVCLSLVAEAQRPVRTLVFKKCNSTVAATQIRPAEWDYAKPYEDIPGPKPLPIVGNAWRFIPYIGNVFCCIVTVVVWKLWRLKFRRRYCPFVWVFCVRNYYMNFTNVLPQSWQYIHFTLHWRNSVTWSLYRSLKETTPLLACHWTCFIMDSNQREGQILCNTILGIIAT